MTRIQTTGEIISFIFLVIGLCLFAAMLLAFEPDINQIAGGVR